MINLDSIKIGLISDNEVIRNVLKILLINHNKPSFNLVLELDSLRSKPSVGENNIAPEVVLCDVSIIGKTSMQRLPTLFQHFQNCFIIILTDMENQDIIIKAMRAGAKGYVKKNASQQELTQVIMNVIQGNFLS